MRKSTIQTFLKKVEAPGRGAILDGISLLGTAWTSSKASSCCNQLFEIFLKSLLLSCRRPRMCANKTSHMQISQKETWRRWVHLSGRCSCFLSLWSLLLFHHLEPLSCRFKSTSEPDSFMEVGHGGLPHHPFSILSVLPLIFSRTAFLRLPPPSPQSLSQVSPPVLPLAFLAPTDTSQLLHSNPSSLMYCSTLSHQVNNSSSQFIY